jgi:hypothetical protein
MRNDFRFTFYTNLNNKMSMNIPRADETATDAEIKKAMDDIIAAEIVITSAGEPRSRSAAELIKTAIKDYTVVIA